MSTANIVSIDPILKFNVPVAVDVTFQTHRGGQRTYRYWSLEAVRGILAGEDPASWVGEQVERSTVSRSTSGASSNLAKGIATAIGEVSEIGESGVAL
jgi:hypothetical protein